VSPEQVSDSVSQELRDFLTQRLASIEQIEIVLLLRSQMSRSWGAVEVAQELKMPPESAAMRLFLLASSGLIVFEPSGVPKYRYEVADAGTEILLAELARLYSDDRRAIGEVIGVPADPLRSFADAFKLKK
jgi:hypothetical protein